MPILALYIGQKSNFGDPVMSMDAVEEGDKGVTTIFGHSFDTTGVFGLGTDADGSPDDAAFPGRSPCPATATSPRDGAGISFFAWLFVFNGLAYLIWSLVSGHLARDLVPTTKDLKHIGASISEHARLKFPK